MGLTADKWLAVTQSLIAAHPLKPKELIEVVLASWEAISGIEIGPRKFRIGKDFYPKPQIMGFLLHELIGLELSVRYPGIWRGEESSRDKDFVFIPDERFSIELKTSSHPKSVSGNRSVSQKSKSSKKSKSGYYLTINFGKWGVIGKKAPTIAKISFGWIDHSDWIGQAAASGQSASLAPEVYAGKMVVLYPNR